MLEILIRLDGVKQVHVWYALPNWKAEDAIHAIRRILDENYTPEGLTLDWCGAMSWAIQRNMQDVGYVIVNPEWKV